MLMAIKAFIIKGFSLNTVLIILIHINDYVHSELSRKEEIKAALSLQPILSKLSS